MKWCMGLALTAILVGGLMWVVPTTGPATYRVMVVDRAGVGNPAWFVAALTEVLERASSEPAPVTVAGPYLDVRVPRTDDAWMARVVFAACERPDGEGSRVVALVRRRGDTWQGVPFLPSVAGGDLPTMAATAGHPSSN